MYLYIYTYVLSLTHTLSLTLSIHKKKKNYLYILYVFILSMCELGVYCPTSTRTRMSRDLAWCARAPVKSVVLATRALHKMLLCITVRDCWSLLRSTQENYSLRHGDHRFHLWVWFFFSSHENSCTFSLLCSK